MKLTRVQKITLIEEYHKNKDIMLGRFCRAHEVSKSSFNFWLQQYRSGRLRKIAASTSSPPSSSSSVTYTLKSLLLIRDVVSASSSSSSSSSYRADAVVGRVCGTPPRPQAGREYHRVVVVVIVFFNRRRRPAMARGEIGNEQIPHLCARGVRSRPGRRGGGA